MKPIQLLMSASTVSKADGVLRSSDKRPLSAWTNAWMSGSLDGVLIWIGSPAVGDFDGDRRPDLAVLSDQLMVMRNRIR
jgi:hypothetical protein